MKTETTTIHCPECGSAIDVNELLKHQIEDSIRREFQEKAKKQAAEISIQLETFQKEKEAFLNEKAQQDSIVEELLKSKEKSLEKFLSEKIKRELEDEKKDQIELMNKELTEKSEKIRELGKKEAEIARLQREKIELKESIEAESERKLNEQIQQEKNKIRKQIENDQELKFATLQKQLEEQKNLTAEMKRKQDQGSMQLQGEVMELAIEDFLTAQFPLDTIEEIKKGANGADCLQIVNTYESQNCGSIYYECKRAKNFSESWIEKFKADIRSKGADLGVLVTEFLPKNMERMGFHQGIYICTFEEFKGLSTVVRESLIAINNAVKSQENKGDKMVLLYDFLTSNEFRMQMEAIVEGFTQMKNDLESEKRAMARIWKQREKQIFKVRTNAINMHASVRGIAGNAIQKIETLELDYSVKEIENTEEYE